MPRSRLTAASPQNFEHPAVIFGNALGDQLMALPALRALTSLFPSRLSLICMPGFRRKFFSDLPLRSVCEVAMTVRAGQRRFDAAAVAKRIGKCDLFLSLNPWRSKSLDRLVRILSPALSVGLMPPCKVALAKKRKKHAIDSAFSVPRYLKPSLRVDAFASPPRIPDRVGPRIREYLRAVARGKRVLAIHNESKPHKVWPTDRLSKLMGEFLERHQDFVIFLLDLFPPRMKIERCPDRVLHSRGLPLHYAFEVIRESELFLGVDSCMLHAADLCRVPGVGLFGRTNPRSWGFRFSTHLHVRDKRGLNHISEAAVLKALESLMRHE